MFVLRLREFSGGLDFFPKVLRLKRPREVGGSGDDGGDATGGEILECLPIGEGGPDELPVDVIQDLDVLLDTYCVPPVKHHASSSSSCGHPGSITTPSPAGSSAPVVSPVAEVVDASSSRTVTKAIAVCNSIWGTISYYRNGNFEAVCGNPLHGKHCKLVRRGMLAKRVHGRPLGFLSAWLQYGHDASVPDAYLHLDVTMLDFPFDVRESARKDLLFVLGGAELADFEKDAELGRDREPAESS